MNLLESLAHVYDMHADIAGVRFENSNAVLLPLFHTFISAQITITIDLDGNFISAEKVDKDRGDVSIIVPATIDSASRAGRDAPPDALNDKLIYLANDLHLYLKDAQLISASKKRNCAYKKQLDDWCESSYSLPQLQAVREYSNRETFTADLIKSGIVSTECSNDKKYINVKEKINGVDILSCVARFKVIIPECNSNIQDKWDGYVAETWKNVEIFRSWTEYYIEKIERTNHQSICYVTGEPAICTNKHPCGLRGNGDWAKMISSNETDIIKFSGDWFRTDTDAVNIGMLLSQKAHNALKWLIEKQGKINGNNIRLFWDASGNPVKFSPYAATPYAFGDGHYGLYNDKEKYLEYLEDMWRDIRKESKGEIYYFLELDTSNKKDKKGRLSIMDYRELSAGDVCERIMDWHKEACWLFQNDKISYTGAPSIHGVVLALCGRENDKIMEVSNGNLYSLYFKRIYLAIMRGLPIPLDIHRGLLKRASCPFKFKHRSNWLMTVQTTCAIVNRDIQKGGIMLDRESTDRSYLFGRLLAIADHLERTTFKDYEIGRRTNAERYMPLFARLPAKYWNIIFSRVQPYIKKLDKWHMGGNAYVNMATKVISQFVDGDYSNEILYETYILGFSAQMNYLNRREYAMKQKE